MNCCLTTEQCCGILVCVIGILARRLWYGNLCNNDGTADNEEACAKYPMINTSE